MPGMNHRSAGWPRAIRVDADSRTGYGHQRADFLTSGTWISTAAMTLLSGYKPENCQMLCLQWSESSPCVAWSTDFTISAGVVTQSCVISTDMAALALPMDNSKLLPDVSVCTGSVGEYGSATLTCPGGGGLISNVDAAFFGTPNTPARRDKVPGCGYTQNLACNASMLWDKVQDLCVGKASCSIPATNTFAGGDPCRGVSKKLVVGATCSYRGINLGLMNPNAASLNSPWGWRLSGGAAILGTTVAVDALQDCVKLCAATSGCRKFIFTQGDASTSSTCACRSNAASWVAGSANQRVGVMPPKRSVTSAPLFNRLSDVYYNSDDMTPQTTGVTSEDSCINGCLARPSCAGYVYKPLLAQCLYKTAGSGELRKGTGLITGMLLPAQRNTTCALSVSRHALFSPIDRDTDP